MCQSAKENLTAFAIKKLKTESKKIDLTINNDKSGALIFITTRRKLSILPSYKYLGITLDK